MTGAWHWFLAAKDTQLFPNVTRLVLKDNAIHFLFFMQTSLGLWLMLLDLNNE
jgi:hypothetical protein